jgi:hypothetical protein
MFGYLLLSQKHICFELDISLLVIIKNSSRIYNHIFDTIKVSEVDKKIIPKYSDSLILTPGSYWKQLLKRCQDNEISHRLRQG